MSRKILIFGFIIGIISSSTITLCFGGATSSSSSNSAKQAHHFAGSSPYSEQLLPAEDNRANLASSAVGQNSYQLLSTNYQDPSTGKQYNGGDSYATAGTSQSTAVNSFGSNSASTADSSYKALGGNYQSSVGGYDTPIIQDSYGAPKPNSGYGPAPKPSYGPAKPSTSYGPAMGDSYAYHYQHYPLAQGGYGEPEHVSGGGGGSGGGKGGLFSGLGGLGSSFGGLGSLGDGFSFDGFGLGGGDGEGGGLAGGAGGLAVVKALVIAVKAVKGILKFKSFFVLGLLFLLVLPVALLFFPIPVISIVPTGSTTVSSTNMGRKFNSPSTYEYQQQSIGRQLILTLTEKVLNAEECLERIICKLPQIPNKNYQKHAKSLWTEYGTKYVTSSRVQRGIEAYFDEDGDEIVTITENEPAGKQHKKRNLGNNNNNNKQGQGNKNRAFKCNQRFKCSNKFF